MISFLKINFELEQQMQMTTKKMKISGQVLLRKSSIHFWDTL